MSRVGWLELSTVDRRVRFADSAARYTREMSGDEAIEIGQAFVRHGMAAIRLASDGETQT